MHNLIISTGMCSDAEGEESYYSQVGGVSSSSSFLKVYWRCVALFFASSVRHNPTAQHKLFVNRPGVPDIDAFKTDEFLSSLGVEVVVVPFTYAPPPDYYGAWRNTFYLLDIIKHISATSQPGEQYMIADSDCLFVKSADNFVSAINQHGLLTYDTQFPPEEDANGLTRLGLQALYQEMSGQPVPETPGYCGGDFLAGTAEAMQKFAAEIDPIWEVSMQRHTDHQVHFNTEEHLMSYVVYKLGYPVGAANPFISRIWTGRKYQTARPSDFELTLWHTPAEKKYGLRRLFQVMTQKDSRFWTVEPGDEFARYVAPFLGIPQRSLLKRTQDLSDAVRWQLHSRLVQPYHGKLGRVESRNGNT
jgi:hypothetical protein